MQIMKHTPLQTIFSFSNNLISSQRATTSNYRIKPQFCQMANYEEKITELFDRACAVLRMRGLGIRFMEWGRVVNTKKTYSVGKASIAKKIITLDIYTPKFRKPKSVNGILRVIAHEVAHYQKLPYYQKYRGRLIIRQHYPAFYRQINRNIEKIKKDKELGEYFG